MGRTGPIRSSRTFRLGMSAMAATLFVTLGAAAPAFAAGPPAGHGHGPPGTSGGGTSVTVTPATGSDISWPQCGGAYPTAAFGIVGVNGGLANDENPCFGPTAGTAATQTELYWAVNDVTHKETPPVSPSLYVNTADPGNVSGHTPVADWPTSTPLNASNPYTTCTTVNYRSHGKTLTIGADSPACAWAYGYDKATQDLKWLVSAATTIDTTLTSSAVPTTPAAYPWWLDVETGNTWQSGTTGLAMNIADLEGVVAALETASATVGVYSTSSQWTQITGTPTSMTTVLGPLPDWIPGASSSASATTYCGTAQAFTNGGVALTQWTATFDEDRAC